MEKLIINKNKIDSLIMGDKIMMIMVFEGKLSILCSIFFILELYYRFIFNLKMIKFWLMMKSSLLIREVRENICDWWIVWENVLDVLFDVILI